MFAGKLESSRIRLSKLKLDEPTLAKIKEQINNYRRSRMRKVNKSFNQRGKTASAVIYSQVDIETTIFGENVKDLSRALSQVDIETTIFGENVKDLSRALEKVGRHSDAEIVRAAGKSVAKQIR